MEEGFVATSLGGAEDDTSTATDDDDEEEGIHVDDCGEEEEQEEEEEAVDVAAAAIADSPFCSSSTCEIEKLLGCLAGLLFFCSCLVSLSFLFFLGSIVLGCTRESP